MDKVCVPYNYFVFFLFIVFIIIGGTLYHCYQLSVNNKQKIKKLYDNLDELMDKQSSEVREVNEAREASHIPSQNPPTPPTLPTPPPVVEYRLPYNISTRSIYGDYQLVGYVYQPRYPDQMFRLMGRQIYNSRYEYYVIHPDNGIKIQIKVKNDWELNTGDRVQIPGFHGQYIVEIYDMDRPF